MNQPVFPRAHAVYGTGWFHRRVEEESSLVLRSLAECTVICEVFMMRSRPSSAVTLCMLLFAGEYIAI